MKINEGCIFSEEGKKDIILHNQCPVVECEWGYCKGCPYFGTWEKWVQRKEKEGEELMLLNRLDSTLIYIPMSTLKPIK